MRLLPTLTLALLLVWCAAEASAQDPRLVTPQPEHELLERLSGEWSFDRLSPQQEGAEQQSLASGTISAEMVGAYFLVSRWSGTQYGFDYEAVQTLGYDVEEGRYSGAWMDSFMSFTWPLSGSMDEETQYLTIETRGPSPTGGTLNFRERIRFDSDDSVTIFGEMQQGDDWTLLTETRLTRKP